jgi:hypothetical protein
MAGDLPYIFAPIDKNIKIARAPNKSIKDSRDDPRINNALARRNKLK